MSETYLFSEDEIRFHLCALRKLAFADGVFHENEKRFIEQIAEAYTASFPQLKVEELFATELSDEEFAQNLEKLKSNVTCSRLFLKDLISLGHIDEEYSEPEKTLVREIGSKLDVSEETICNLEKAVDDLLNATLFMSNVLYS